MTAGPVNALGGAGRAGMPFAGRLPSSQEPPESINDEAPSVHKLERALQKPSA
jgi:hypothetical protein